MTLFDAVRPEMISDETRAINAELVARLAAKPLPTDLSAARASFSSGGSAIPVSPRSPRAELRTVSAPTGDVTLRVIAPDKARGAYLHIHGGGWMFGTADMMDDKLEMLAAAGLVCVSVDYRLAPEHPYPAAVDDCVAAARWLIEEGRTEFGTSNLTIGGESAGAHLAGLTLLRLREEGQSVLRAANLMYGYFDLAMTPSARRAEAAPVVNRDALAMMSACFLAGADPHDPSVSPLYADLTGLPPTLFTVGTLDPLLDDSLFMHARWQAAGNAAELALYPGGLHGFTAFEGALSADANARAREFLSAAT